MSGVESLMVNDDLASYERNVTAAANYEFGELTDEQRRTGLKHIQMLKTRMNRYRERQAARAKARRSRLERLSA